MGETFGPDGPEQPGWDRFWEHFQRHRSPPDRPAHVPQPDDGERLRRARIRKAALDLVRALAGSDAGLEHADYASALLAVQELVDDLDLCANCKRNEWECACCPDGELHEEGPDDGFGMDRVVLTALDHAGIALPTFWNGEPADCRRVRVIVGPPPVASWWSAQITGSIRDAVEVRIEGRTFYIDDQDGTGWAHVTVRQGDPADARPTMPVKRVVGDREPEPRPERTAAEADLYAALAVRSGVPVERVRQFFEAASPEVMRRMLEQPGPISGGGGGDPIPLSSRRPKAAAEPPPSSRPSEPRRSPAAPTSARNGAPPAASPASLSASPADGGSAPAPARKGRKERIRDLCRDLIDIYHEPKPGASDRELLDEAAKVIERERKALGED